MRDFLAYGESFIEIGAGSYSRSMIDKLYEDWGDEWLEIRLKNEEIRENLGLESALLPVEARKQINKILEQTGFIKRLEELRKLEK